ncbi:lytic polysaccharide monooxygenase auxiliary activity family 9 protein [Glycomyces harbinensis]|jgi:predicted carbohydrate-binding protein with CBM5 and CBM33 domain|uniref:Chitin-binding protein n=1 Tax=Glycomyces harbinensis TaxID=58114 RepID=A0A1G6STW9_9ACTN|nr:lytic polysaccharide monooxygenase [Glycomyces harbinensis]SDD20218.1 chitin-binding protein [Glycomyces harbinensis]
MRKSRKIILSLAGAATLAISASMAALAWGHGYNSDPPSRSALCAEGEVTDCGAISYEPQSVEGPKGFPAAGPADGQLCAGGNDRFSELDDPRGGNWPTTAVDAGATTFTWTMTVNHATATFDYYITNANYDPTQPLTRDDLGLTPIASIDMGGAQPDHTMTQTVNLPARTGQHLVFAVWNIADTTNAFYSCIDVDFGGGGSGEPTDPPTTTDPGTGDGCDAPAWASGSTYNGGDEVVHGSAAYRASWWTQGEEPGTTGEWGVWKQTATC